MFASCVTDSTLNEAYQQALAELNTQKAIDLEEDDILIITQRSIDLTRLAVDKVQQQVLTQGFPEVETEINFFSSCLGSVYVTQERFAVQYAAEFGKG